MAEYSRKFSRKDGGKRVYESALTKERVQKSMIKLFQKKQQVKKEFDRENQKAVLRCSICTGEQVAGFKNIHTGKFEEVMLIKNGQDLTRFQEMYDLKEVVKEY